MTRGAGSTDAPSKPRIIIGMPAFNEAKYIGSLVLRVKKYGHEVLVVDDGSADHTAEIASLAGAVVIRHGENRGYGGAIKSLIEGAKTRQADVLVILDADSQHNPDEIPRLIDAVLAGNDVVIGSRELQQNDIAAYRRFGQRVLANLTYVASRQKLSDTESGFRAYSKRAINTLQLKESGMAISSEIVSAAAGQGLKIAEVPISVSYSKDSSTLNPVQHGVGVLTRIMVMISEKRPLLFFGVGGGLLLALGLVLGAIVVRLYYFETGILATGTALVSILFVTAGLLTIFTGLILDVLARRLRNL